jgi:uncharacterized protein YdeI (YjbR/CyaY-like superfamily)
VTTKPPAPHYFATAGAFRAWLEAHHAHAKELVVGFYKVGARKDPLRYAAAVDAALCFGWIDGVRRSVDEERYCARFTPRRPRSTWSNLMIARAEALIAEGQMRPPGLAAYGARSHERSGIYAFENAPRTLDEAQERALRANAKAWAYWENMPPGYRRTVSFWLSSGKKEATRARRLAVLLECCEEGRKIPTQTLEKPPAKAK